MLVNSKEIWYKSHNSDSMTDIWMPQLQKRLVHSIRKGHRLLSFFLYYGVVMSHSMSAMSFISWSLVSFSLLMWEHPSPTCEEIVPRDHKLKARCLHRHREGCAVMVWATGLVAAPLSHLWLIRVLPGSGKCLWCLECMNFKTNLHFPHKHARLSLPSRITNKFFNKQSCSCSAHSFIFLRFWILTWYLVTWIIQSLHSPLKYEVTDFNRNSISCEQCNFQMRLYKHSTYAQRSTLPRQNMSTCRGPDYTLALFPIPSAKQHLSQVLKGDGKAIFNKTHSQLAYLLTIACSLVLREICKQRRLACVICTRYAAT